LNSIPTTIISNDPNDPEPLMPGHFLIGHLQRWDGLLSSINESKDFWIQRSHHSNKVLPTRKTTSPDFQPAGDVLIKEDNLLLSRLHIGTSDVL